MWWAFQSELVGGKVSVWTEYMNLPKTKFKFNPVDGIKVAHGSIRRWTIKFNDEYNEYKVHDDVEKIIKTQT